jgi:hypothetical protein
VEIALQDGLRGKVGAQLKDRPKARNHGKVRLQMAHLKAESQSREETLIREETPFKEEIRTR